MQLPEEIQKHINEYAQPLTRPDFKQGSYFIRNLSSFKYDHIKDTLALIHEMKHDKVKQFSAYINFTCR